jgi:choline kinase
MPLPSRFDVIVLAAGLGLRLGEMAAGQPKALVDVAGSTLLARAIAFATALGPARIVVVGGYGIGQVRQALAGLDRGDVELVENVRFRAGNLLSVEAALPHVTGGFLLANVDHVFPVEAAARVTATVHGHVTAFCEFERAPEADEMKVVLDEGGRVIRIAKTLTAFAGAYIGMTYVPAAQRAAYADAVRAAHRACGDAAVAEHALQALADAGVPAHAASLDGITWAEVDTPDDHRRATAWLADGTAPR